MASTQVAPRSYASTSAVIESPSSEVPRDTRLCRQEGTCPGLPPTGTERISWITSLALALGWFLCASRGSPAQSARESAGKSA